MSNLIYNQLSSYFIDSNKSHRECRDWMKQSETIQSIQTLLNTDKRVAKRFLGLLYIYREREVIMANTPLDIVLKRLTIGLKTRVENLESGEALRYATVRAKPIFHAWKARDKTTLLRYLEDESVRRGLRPLHNGEESQEELLEILRVVGGEDVVNRVQARCNRARQVVHADDLERTIANTMERAFWDATQEKVRQGEMAPLYDVLTQVKDCVRALLAGAPITRSQFDDRFDVCWIQERGDAGQLTRDDVGNLSIYLADQVGRMQAPADDDVVQPWVEAVRKRANEDDTLQQYLPDVVFVIRDAIHYLQLIYQRIQK